MVRSILLVCSVSILSLSLSIAQAETWYVSPTGMASPVLPSGARTAPSIQSALDQAAPGDTVALADGDYFEDFHSVRNGEKDRPIRIRGSRASIVHGSGKRSHIVDINHDYHQLVGFTIDGLAGDPERKESYRNKLVYVQGLEPHRGVEGTLIDDMELRHAGGECLRLRYLAHDNEVRNSRISRCGIYDFKFSAGGKNGEGIYIGTSSTQWADGRNPTADPDRSTNNWIHHNAFQTWANECVDIKEGSEHNLVEHNSCEYQLDPKSAGFDARGDNNVFRYNSVGNNQGAAFRLGGHLVGERRYGVGNQVYGNRIGNNGQGGLNILVRPQGRICGNQIQYPGLRPVRGRQTDEIRPETPCPGSADGSIQEPPTANLIPAVLADANPQPDQGASQP